MGISEMARTKPNLIMKSIVPVVMSGVLSVYGLVLSAVIVANGKKEKLRRVAKGIICSYAPHCANLRVQHEPICKHGWHIIPNTVSVEVLMQRSLVCIYTGLLYIAKFDSFECSTILNEFKIASFSFVLCIIDTCTNLLS